MWSLNDRIQILRSISICQCACVGMPSAHESLKIATSCVSLSRAMATDAFCAYKSFLSRDQCFIVVFPRLQRMVAPLKISRACNEFEDLGAAYKTSSFMHLALNVSTQYPSDPG